MTRLWYQQNIVSYLLMPFASVYRMCITIRRWLYQSGILTSRRLPVPVIIVGNLSVGGNGKTPLVIWLVEFLKKQGFKPGVISRGYGGTLNRAPHLIDLHDLPGQVGDEPLLIAKTTGCPVVIARDRPAAGQFLLSQTDCNIIVSDDGLQHYALQRDIEIIAVDGLRRFGNELCLPAGPLREPLKRLSEVNFIVVTQGVAKNPTEYSMLLQPSFVYRLQQPADKSFLNAFHGKKVHAVAGIGNPERFFMTLREAGFEVVPHVHPDHATFTSQDFNFADDLPILITEKDAVKCTNISNDRIWVVSVKPELPASFGEQLLEKLR